MDQYLENRFRYLKEKSKEELESLKLSIIKELEEYENDLNDSSISSQQKNELYGDIRYAKEKLTYLEFVLGEKDSSKHI